MKTLRDFINESRSIDNEWSVDYTNDGKFGFMYYEANAGLVGVISFDKLEKFAKSQGFNVEDYMGIDKLKVGESVYDGASYIYTRIW